MQLRNPLAPTIQETHCFREICRNSKEKNKTPPRISEEELTTAMCSVTCANGCVQEAEKIKDGNMSAESPTIKDVAAAAGVGAMTVSNTLRGKPGVRAETREKVLAAARRLNYEPNVSASMLKSGRSGIIHIVVNEFDAPFYSKLVETLSTSITEHGLVPFPEQTRYSPVAAERVLASPPLGRRLFDGEILSAEGIEAGPRLRELTTGRPAVLINACEREPTMDSVDLPNESGSGAAIRHLVGRGCRTIALVGRTSTSGDTDDAHRLRMAAARDALAACGLPHAESVMFDALEQNAGIIAGRAIADSPTDFDGAWCTDDAAALGVIRGLADRGLHVPDDIRVIGYDGVSAGAYSVPSLSTIAPDMTQLAQIALDMLMRRLENPHEHYTPSVATVGFTLLERESTS